MKIQDLIDFLTYLTVNCTPNETVNKFISFVKKKKFAWSELTLTDLMNLQEAIYKDPEKMQHIQGKSLNSQLQNILNDIRKMNVDQQHLVKNAATSIRESIEAFDKKNMPTDSKNILDNFGSVFSVIENYTGGNVFNLLFKDKLGSMVAGGVKP